MGSFQIPGLGSGIDWTNLVASVRAAEEGALARTLGVRQARVASETAAFSQVKGFLAGLKTSVDSFDFVGNFKTKSVSSSDTAVLTGTATLSALNQSATVRVDELATNEVWHLKHSGVDNSVSASGGSFVINVRGQNHSLTVAAGTTLKQLASQINEAGIGVTATVFDTGAGGATPARLSIQDNSLGKYNTDQTAGVNFNITIGSPSGDLTALNPDASLAVVDGNTGSPATYEPIIEGKDSKIYVNQDTNTPIYSDSNTVLNVIPGVTLTLKSADNANWKTLTVSESTDQAASKINSLLKKYNDVILALRKAVSFDPNLEVQTNPTAGDGTLRSILSQLQNAFTTSVDTLPGGAAVKSLADLGVVRNVSEGNKAGDGTLMLQDSKLNDLLSSNYEEVLEFFQGGTFEGSTEKFEGFAKKMQDLLNGMVSATGSVTGKIDSLNSQGKRLEEDIQTKLERIVAKQERLKNRFARLETELSRMSSQQSQLGSAINSIALNNQAIARR